MNKYDNPNSARGWLIGLLTGISITYVFTALFQTPVKYVWIAFMVIGVGFIAMDIGVKNEVF